MLLGHVWERTCVTKGVTMMRVHVTCLKMWDESDEFAVTTLLQSEHMHLWDLVNRSRFEY